MSNQPPRDPPIFAFFNEIGIIEQLARNRAERALPDGLTMSQFSVLNHLVRLGGEWAPARLARAFQVTKGAMTNTLQRLEARGLIELRGDPNDGRAKLVQITPEGTALRHECVQRLAPMMAAISQNFTSQEFESALPLLQRLRAHLDQAREI